LDDKEDPLIVGSPLDYSHHFVERGFKHPVQLFVMVCSVCVVHGSFLPAITTPQKMPERIVASCRLPLFVYSFFRADVSPNGVVHFVSSSKIHAPLMLPKCVGNLPNVIDQDSNYFLWLWCLLCVFIRLRGCVNGERDRGRTRRRRWQRVVLCCVALCCAERWDLGWIGLDRVH
jgi:hypothetical protein